MGRRERDGHIVFHVWRHQCNECGRKGLRREGVIVTDYCLTAADSMAERESERIGGFTLFSASTALLTVDLVYICSL